MRFPSVQSSKIDNPLPATRFAPVDHSLLGELSSLETAQYIAGHADGRTTNRYDCRDQKATLEDIERIRY